MEIILLKSAKIGGKLKFPSDSETHEVDEKLGEYLIEKGIAKDANEKETVIVKDETLSLEIEKLKEEKKQDLIYIDGLELDLQGIKELLQIAIDSPKGTVPDGAEQYIEVDLTK